MDVPQFQVQEELGGVRLAGVQRRHCQGGLSGHQIVGYLMESVRWEH